MSQPLVVFDLGGVLLQIHHTWDAVLNTLGENPLGRPSPWRQADYKPLSDYQDGSLSEEAYIERLSADLGLSAERAREAHASMLIADYPGALNLVEDLRRAGVYTACLSNTNELHWRRLLDPIDHPAIAALDRRFSSFEIQANKPKPEAFAAVLAGFPDVGRRFFFDDLPENVAAAVELGWEAYTVDPEDNPPAAMRKILVESGIL